MLLSRVADALYWISRYLERAEHTARLIDVRVDLRPRPCRHRLEPRADRAPVPAASDCRIGVAATSSTLAGSCALRPRQPQFGGRLRDGGARERAAGARRDQLGHVGAAQRALPAGEADARRRAPGRAAPHYVVAQRHRRRAPASRASPTRRWDTARAGSTCRSAAFSSARAPRPRCSTCSSPSEPDRRACPPRRPGRVGRAAAIVLRARSLLPALHRRRPRRSASPSSCCSTPEFPRSVRFAAARLEGALRALAALQRPRRRRTRRTAGGPSARIARLRHRSTRF